MILCMKHLDKTQPHNINMTCIVLASKLKVTKIWKPCLSEVGACCNISLLVTEWCLVFHRLVYILHGAELIRQRHSDILLPEIQVSTRADILRQCAREILPLCCRGCEFIYYSQDRDDLEFRNFF